MYMKLCVGFACFAAVVGLIACGDSSSGGIDDRVFNVHILGDSDDFRRIATVEFELRTRLETWWSKGSWKSLSVYWEDLVD